MSGISTHDRTGLGRIPEPDPAKLAKARRVVLAAAAGQRWPRQDVADVLAMLGLTPARKPPR